MTSRRFAAALLVLVTQLPAGAERREQKPGRVAPEVPVVSGPSLLGGGPLEHCHNVYPEDGQWRDRLERALSVTQRPIVIEQDIALDRRGRSVVSHDAELSGAEPTLEDHFFRRVRPLIDKALAGGERTWPALVLHLDFKTNEREHHRAVWDLLRAHESWLTTAPAGGGAVKPGPLVVLTENGANQERDFTEWAAAHGSYLLFGSIPPPALPRSDDPLERARILRAAAPDVLIPAGATVYRRWVNLSWGAVEEGGPSRAGGWTRDEEARLRTIVNRAHDQGLLVRFYTLNGHPPSASRGWNDGYNFGSLEAARERWEAAVRARVDLIATDQYGEVAFRIRHRGVAAPPRPQAH